MNWIKTKISRVFRNVVGFVQTIFFSLSVAAVSLVLGALLAPTILLGLGENLVSGLENLAKRTEATAERLKSERISRESA